MLAIASAAVHDWRSASARIDGFLVPSWTSPNARGQLDVGI